MRRFSRPAPPAQWTEKESAWLTEQLWLEGDPPKLTARAIDPLGWSWEGRTLRQHYVAVIFGEGDRHCAYCDGLLGATSGPQIDHFIAKHAAPWLALDWSNLFPTCSHCNSVIKGADWSCRLVRPDIDPVEDLFIYVPTPLGVAAKPHPALSRSERARVRLTIVVLGLNLPARMKARNDVLQHLERSSRLGEAPEPIQYRFLADALGPRG